MGFWDALCVGALSIVFQRVTAMAFAAFGVFCGAQDPCEAVRALASVLQAASAMICKAGIGVFDFYRCVLS